MSNGLILGFFDGVHLAHQAVIESALSKVSNVILITFKNSPAEYFENEYEYIMPREKSIDRIKHFGVNDVVELNFSEIANISAEDYIKSLVNQYSPVLISTGFNHTFGRGKAGNSMLLKKMSEMYGFEYNCISPQMFGQDVISSTLIKYLLKNGDLDCANRLLGCNFFISGTVIKGKQIGQKIGFPTANLVYPDNIVKLPYGVYYVQVGEKYGMLNWGVKPTIDNCIEPVVEVNIFDFDGNLYNKNIEIKFIKKIRNEKKFNSLDELKHQIEEDKKECLKS